MWGLKVLSYIFQSVIRFSYFAKVRSPAVDSEDHDCALHHSEPLPRNQHQRYLRNKKRTIHDPQERTW